MISSGSVFEVLEVWAATNNRAMFTQVYVTESSECCLSKKEILSLWWFCFTHTTIGKLFLYQYGSIISDILYVNLLENSKNSIATCSFGFAFCSYSVSMAI